MVSAMENKWMKHVINSKSFSLWVYHELRFVFNVFQILILEIFKMRKKYGSNYEIF